MSRFRFLGGFLLSVLLNAQAPTSQTLPKPTLTLTLEPATQTVNLGAPVKVNVIQTNPSDHDIVVWEEPGSKIRLWPSYHVEVWDAKGNFAPHTEFGRRQYQGRGTGAVPFPPDARPDFEMLQSNPVDVPIKRGESIVGVLEVSKLYDFSAPGTYTIQVSHIGEVGTLGLVKSNTASITVKADK